VEEKKNSFVMYANYMEHIELLDRMQRGDLLTAIMLYAEQKELPQMDGITKMAFSFIKAQMDRDKGKYEQTVNRRREAGKLGGRPKKEENKEESKRKQTKAKKANGFLEKQTKAKKPDNVNGNVNDNDNGNVNDNDIKESGNEKDIPPTVEQVKQFCLERNNNVDPECFVDFYESKGWVVGKAKMKDWKAAVRNWERSEEKMKAVPRKASTPNKFNNFNQRTYDYAKLEKQLLDVNKE
jgi:hypothetical protein